jgi:hypothetical protein
MNIFAIDLNPAEAARLHCDRHVVKMPLEAGQMLCTALRAAGHTGPLPYKPTHAGHPCTLWAALTRANFIWLARLGLALVAEHGLRYSHTKAGKRGHAAGPVIREALALADQIPAGDLTPFALAMPEEYRGPDAVQAYRRYYAGDKASIATWRAPSTRPDWMPS